MMTRATSSFEVTGWEQTPYEEEVKGPRLSRAKVRKSFRGDLVGESTAELLLCQADSSDLSAGAGYVASERFVGRLGDRAGSFVLQHWGVSGGGGPQRTSGHVVPGTGANELVGLSGTIEISVDPQRGHTLTLDYEIP